MRSRDEFIKNDYIPILPVFQIGLNYPTIFFSLFLFAFFLLLFLLLSLLFHSLSSGAFSPSDPAPWKGRVTLLRRAHQTFWCSRAVESPVLGDRGPSRKFCPRKNGRPHNGLLESHARVEQVSSLSGWPQAPSGVPAVLFPFFREDVHGSPSEYKRFPLPEKNPKTHGVLASQDSVPQGGSQGSATKKVRDRTGGYRFRHHNSCGTRETTPGKCACSVHALRMREVKRKSKRETRTTATRFARKHLTDCANRTSILV